MTRSLPLLILLTLVLLAAPGCQTYVNIPGQAGDAANHDPNGKTVRKVLTLALQAAITDGRVATPVQLMLPEGTTALTYAHIAHGLGDQAVVPEDQDMSGVNGVIFAKAIRIRGHEAEIDIVRPVGEGLDQLVTVYLTWMAVGDWSVDSVRVWRGVPIED